MRDFGHDWHQTTVSKVETEQRPISLREAYDLARALDRNLRDFLVGEASDHERSVLAYERAKSAEDQARLGLEDATTRYEAAKAEVQRVIASAPKASRKRKL
jgi:hypothetical protein